ncbi:lysophospholipid acyltransferase family protein [Thermoactinospora rubra]|uniref:lysophospholipid acyltransferase family protein n=1 Tax=Thermoactinospora rubra TaxID=1088767 RepID=UPI000A10592D|nr:lysophospholipid acyltransferase family protein [Thermoactinospora rubra]
MSPWFPVSPCTPSACVAPPAAAAPWWLRALRLLALAAVVLAGLAAVPFARGRAGVARWWCRALLRALGVRMEVRRGFAVYGGAGSPRAVPAAGAALVVANHVSWLDPLVVAAALPATPLAKREVARWPLVGTLVRAAGAILIDRGSLRALPGAVAEIADALRSGRSVAAFPEGTTWCGRGAGRFRPAVFQAALDAETPVRPVALCYRENGKAGSTAPAYVGDDSLAASVLRIVAVRGLVVEVTVLPPVTAGDRRRLTRVAEAAILSITGVLSIGGRPEPPLPRRTAGAPAA